MKSPLDGLIARRRTHRRLTHLIRRDRPRRAMTLEPLEDRRMLAVIGDMDIDEDVDFDDIDDLVLGLNDPAGYQVQYGEAPAIRGDVDGDGDLDFDDIDDFVQLLPSLPVTLVASLANDTAPGGTTNSDSITSDPTLLGTITEGLENVQTLEARIDGGAFTALAVDQFGDFSFDPPLALDGSADGPHTARFLVTDTIGNSAAITDIAFTLDTLGPGPAVFGLEAASRLDPANPALTTLSGVSIAGQTDPDQLVTLEPGGAMTTAAGDGSFSFGSLSVVDGLNPFTTTIEDIAGNPTSFTLSITKVMPPPDFENGGTLDLAEGSNWLDEHAFLIDLGQAEGNRRLMFDVAATFDTTDTDVLVGDLLQVYLVDPTNPGTTLLDRGREGGALFSLSETGADFLPGLVTYNGTTVTIDLTSLAGETEGLLIFQLINGDSDDRTTATVSNLANTVDEEGVASPVFFAPVVLSTAGPSVDLTGYSVVTDGSIDVAVTNVRVDGEAGSYIADLGLRNTGDPVSRALAVRLNNLPVGVTLVNASGVDMSGNPYLNLMPAITSGGLDTGASMTPVELMISNSDGMRFELEVDVLSTGPNSTPVFSPIGDVTVMPGDTSTIMLDATDPDGDTVTYSLRRNGDLPNTRLADNQLSFSPTPDQLGSYPVTVRASDGLMHAEQSFTLNVIADPVTTTRLSGQIMDSDGITPLEGVPVEVNGVTELTDAGGFFTIEVPSLAGDDAVKVRADEANIPGKTYPFVAEKIHLVLAVGPFDEVNNVITRPIYLPALDVAGGTTVDPEANAMVEQEIAPGEMASVFVEEGTLLMDDGQGGMVPFNGVLSITEVPADLTPAALPPNLLPDIVVTIQPGEMVFTDPAELTLPNRAGYEPGTVMDLWSINPITGQFDNVGVGQVSGDGSVVETISGGVLNSSWHLFTPVPDQQRDPQNEDANQEQKCNSCEGKTDTNGEATEEATSQVELHSGAIREAHDMVTYQSLGVTRGLTLHYNSQRADPQPIIHFGANNVQGAEGRFLVSRLSFSDGTSVEQVPGFAGGLGLPGGEHFWQLPVGTNDIKAALQGDLSNLSSGVYTYTLTSGFLLLGDNGLFSGRMTDTTADIVHVNAIDSPFGAGWELGGIQQFVENPDGSLLLIDGNGANTVFEPLAGQPGQYDSPVGDFSTLIKNGDGTFTRTMTDQMVYQYGNSGRLISMTDRNGNQTQHVYVGDQLTKIVDPVGLETVFTYTGERITSITDPANRITELDYDATGNLIQITDPDTSTRNFEYDAIHHIVAEIDENSNREETLYGFHGRSVGSIRKDGTALSFDPVQTRGLFPAELTANHLNAPVTLLAAAQATAQTVDSRGNVLTTTLDQAGQTMSAADAEGNHSSRTRNTDNLISTTSDARGNRSVFTYDQRGNLTSILDEVVRSAPLFPGEKFDVGDFPVAVSAGDFNGDGVADLVIANDGSGDVSVLMGLGGGRFAAELKFAVGNRPYSVTTGEFNGDGVTDLAVANMDSDDVSVLLGNGDGTFAAQQLLAAGDGPFSVTTGDFNGDGVTDLATAHFFSDDVSVFLGNGDGTFAIEQRFAAGDFATSLTTGDFNGDGLIDLAVSNGNSGDISVLLGNGDGTFAAEQRFAVGDGPRAVTTGDFNGDGAPDVATANFLSGDVSVLIGQGDGTFASEQRFPAVGALRSITTGDFNGDSVIDLVCTNPIDVSVLLGNGDGTFAAEQRVEARDGPSFVTTEDFNRDGVIDLAVANRYSNDVSVLLGEGDGTFINRQHFNTFGNPSSVITDDFDGDGFADLVTADRADYPFGTVSVLLNNGDGTFGSPSAIAVGGVHTATTGDFNGDGVPDLATANKGISSNSDDVSILLGQGDGTFGAEQRFFVGYGGVRSVTTADFDGDGLTDLATQSIFTDEVVILLGQGDGTLVTPERFPVGDGPTSVTMGDFNGDGSADLATSNFTSDDVSVLLGNGDGTFQPEQRFAVGDFPSAVMISELNRDGVTDLVIRNSNSNDLSVLLGNGDGTFQSEQRIPAADNLRSVTTGDFDGDGVADLATAHYGLDEVHVLLGNGDGTFAAAQRFGAGQDVLSVTASDLNGNGADDLATADRPSGVSVLLANGDSGNEGGEQPRVFAYDPVYGQLTSITDELGRVTLFDIDPANGNRLATTQVVGQLDDVQNGETDDLVTTFTYTAHGLVETITDPLGHVTDFDYDALGRLGRITFAVGTPDEAFLLYEYDAAGNRTAAIDENGNRTEFEYDDLNRLKMITEADPDDGGPLLSPVTTFDYDDRGNLTTTTDAASSTTVNMFDAQDRLVLTRDDLNNETSFTYDIDGNLLSVTDPNGNITRNTYDARNRRVSTIDPDGGVTKFRYGSDNNLLVLTDPNGNVTRFVHDARDRLIREVDPLGAVTLFRYDSVDNLTLKTDRNGRVTEFEYDELNRLIEETWRDLDDTVVNTVSYAYDDAGNLLLITDAVSAMTYTYDARDRVKSVDNAGTLAGTGLPKVVLTYGYDGVGNVMSVAEAIDAMAGATTSYQYDDLNRMKSVQQSGAGVTDKLVDMLYNQIGQFDQIDRYSDLGRVNLVARSNFVYDAVNRLETLEHGSAVDPRAIAFYDFEYDAASRITALTDIDGRTDYSYDDRDQLTGADRDVADTRGDESYTYDANGNRENSHLHGSGYVTGPANRLLSDGTFDYEYDDEGNMILRTNIATGEYREFEYDHRNRLTRVADFSSGAVVTQDVQYVYDGLDRRIAKSVDADGAGAGGETTEHYVYDRDNVLLDFLDADGPGATEQPEQTLRYLFGPGVDQILAQENVQSVQTGWLLTDHLGTVRDIVDDAAAVLNHGTYDSFGLVLSQTDPLVTTRYLFTGREFDAETTLFYYRARYYDAGTGRFVSEDPLQITETDVNEYRYAFNRPQQLVDPSGRNSREELATVHSVEGTVEILSGDSDQWVKAKVGYILRDGDAIRTGKRSRAALLFKDGALVRQGPNSTIRPKVEGSGCGDPPAGGFVIRG